MNTAERLISLADVMRRVLEDSAEITSVASGGAVYVSAEVNGYRLHLMESAHPWGAANGLYDLVVQDLARNASARGATLAPLLSENDVTLALFGLRLRVRD